MMCKCLFSAQCVLERGQREREREERHPRLYVKRLSTDKEGKGRPGDGWSTKTEPVNPL